MMVDGAHFAIVFAFVAFGALAQGSTGVGLGLVAAPVMAIVNPSLVPGPVLLLAAGLSFFVLLRDRAAIDKPALARLLAARIPASIAGAITASYLPASWFLLLFAILILMAIVISLLGWTVKRTTSSLLTAGAVSGYMGTITSVGAPPIAIIFQSDKGPLVRGTLGAYFFIGSLISVASLWVFVGSMRSDITLSIWLFPAVALGYLASHPARKFVDAGLLRPAILIICTLSAITLFVRAFA